MRGLLGLIAFIASIWFMRKKKSQLGKGDVSQEALVSDEKWVIWVLCFFSPVLAGAVFYYGWRKYLPTKAVQANKISWMAFLAYMGVSLIIALALSPHLRK